MVSKKKKKKRKKRSSPKLRVIFRPKSEIQAFFSPKIRWSPKKTKKKNRSSPKLRVIFRPGSLGLGWWGGDASLTGAELFEIEADFSAKIVTFRLVGGDASPPSPPPKSATERECHDFKTSKISKTQNYTCFFNSNCKFSFLCCNNKKAIAVLNGKTIPLKKFHV